MLGLWVGEIDVPPPALLVCDAQELRVVFNDWNCFSSHALSRGIHGTEQHKTFVVMTQLSRKDPAPKRLWHEFGPRRASW